MPQNNFQKSKKSKNGLKKRKKENRNPEKDSESDTDSSLNDFVIKKKKVTSKVKMAESENNSQQDPSIDETTDLVASNLPWEFCTEHISDYFRLFGELVFCQFETRLCPQVFSGKCYFRYRKIEVTSLVLHTRHYINCTWIDVKIAESSYILRQNIDVKRLFDCLKHNLEMYEETNREDFWFQRSLKWSEKCAEACQIEHQKTEPKTPEFFKPQTQNKEILQMYRERYR